MKPTAPNQELGFALLIVLWAMVLLALVGMQITGAGRGETRLASRMRDAAAAEAAADGVIHLAMFQLLLPPGRGWEADNTVHTLRDAPWTLTVAAEDLAGRVDLNRASPELLQALLRQFGLSVGQARSLALDLAAWRFPNAAADALEDEARRYRAAGRDYAPPHAPFQSVDEIGLVLGMTQPLLERLRPYLSVDGEGDTEPARAAPPVVQAIREATGQSAFAPAKRASLRAVTITATASGPGGTRVVRRATVRLGALPRGQIWQVLDWRTASGE